MAVFRVIKNKNYTVMSNYHLRDMRLSLKAKGLLSVILSLPENWDYSVHGLSYICKEGMDAIRQAIWELERAGYIFRSRVRNGKGQLKNAEYVIYEEPQENCKETAAPMEEFPVLEQPMHVTPMLENLMQAVPTLENQTQEKPTQLNIYKTNTLPQKGKNNRVRNESNPYPSNPDPTKRAREDSQPIALVSQMRDMIRAHIDYDALVQEYDRDRLDEMVSLMVEVLCSCSPTFTISGNALPSELVKERICSLNSSHIEYAIKSMNETCSDIRNIKQYLLTVLFNAPVSMTNHYDAMIRRDRWEKGSEACSR